jgi:hypothetical protein
MHANARSAMEYMDVADPVKIKYNLGPDLKHTSVALSTAADFLIRSLDCIIRLFTLPEERIVAELKDDYAKLWKEYG